MSILSRKVLAAVAAGLLVGAAVAQPPTTKVPPKSTDPMPPDVVRNADPLGAMLSDAKSAFSKVRDYTCTFTRQERMDGSLSAEQVAAMKVRVQPHSIHIRFARPDTAAGLEMCYVAGSRLGKLRYRPAGAKGVNGFLSVALDDSKVMAENRHQLTQYGIGPTIDLLTTVAGREKTLNNTVEVYTSDYQFAGRNVTRYEIFTRRPHAHRYAHRMLVYVDKESKLPMRFEAYDQPKAGRTTGELLEAYSYSDIKLNAGLGDSEFDY